MAWAGPSSRRLSTLRVEPVDGYGGTCRHVYRPSDDGGVVQVVLGVTRDRDFGGCPWNDAEGLRKGDGSVTYRARRGCVA